MEGNVRLNKGSVEFKSFLEQKAFAESTHS